MFSFAKSGPFDEDIEKATNENNVTDDWSLIMHICDKVTNYQDGSKFCLKAIVKRLNHDVPRVVMQALTLLDACVKNCDKKFLLQVASSEFTIEIQKLLKKMHPQAAVKLKEILQRWALEEFKNDSELCIIPSLYYQLRSEGVEFPTAVKEKPPTRPICTDPNVVTSEQEENDIIKAIEISLKDTGRYSVPTEGTGVGNSFMSDSKQQCEPFKVRALYDFDAAEDNELTIKTGEIILVLDNSNASWWKGSNQRGEGLFPSNFVTEDLEASQPEISDHSAEESDTVVDTTFTGEVKIDEQKIEAVINWLNETDPADEESDPPDMLRLEDEVYKMTPLIEENLHAIDKKMDMLNVVNEKIVSAFDMFHSLSTQVPHSIPPLKQMSSSFIPSQMLPAQSNPASMPYTNIQQQVLYIPVPQPVPTDPHFAGPHTTAISAPTDKSSLSKSPKQSSNGAESTPAAVTGDGHQFGAGAAFAPAPMGGFFIPQGVPVQYAAASGQAVRQPMQLPNPVPGGVNNFPYAVPTMGPYIQMPYYYLNSASAFQPNTTQPQPTTTAESKSPEHSNQPTNSSQPIPTSETTAQPVLTSYSTDLQSLAYGATQPATEQPASEILQ